MKRQEDMWMDNVGKDSARPLTSGPGILNPSLGCVTPAAFLDLGHDQLLSPLDSREMEGKQKIE
jgi:hypothetical protein